MKHNTLISLLAILVGLLPSSSLFGQSDNYSKVRVHVQAERFQLLSDLGIAIEHYEGDFNSGIEFFVNEDERTLLDQYQFQYDVLIEDWRSYYNRRRQKEIQDGWGIQRGTQTASNFGYGSMGGFYTLSEMEKKLDSMHLIFPTITSAKFSIGTTQESRNIWALKISDNPDIDEPEPTVYYDAVHHAREPMAMAVTINYMFWLLENYGSDPRVSYIIDNRELYFVPVVNPDGYAYNQSTDPNGGGMWRKNRNVNTGLNCKGVDLNRNYSFAYGNDPNCASTNSCSGTYKGLGAFSEPESQGVRDLIDSIAPSVAFSTHSVAGKVLMPYGYNSSPPAYEIYSEWASDFSDENDYYYGTTWEMLGYTSCGTTRDYMYSEGVYGWTPEIGGSGFWPMMSEIFPLVDENIRPMFYLAWIAGGYADVQEHEIIGDAVLGGQFSLNVTVKNKGVGGSADNVSVELISSEPTVIPSGQINIGSIPARSTASTGANPFTITMPLSLPGNSFDIEMVIKQDGVESTRETITIFLGAKTTLFVENAESGSSKWVSAGTGKNWGTIADDKYGGQFSMGDSDGGNALNNTSTSLTLLNPIATIPTSNLILEYMAKWSIEEDDSCLLQLSIDSGSTWKTLKVYRLNSSWFQETIDLTSYASNPSLLFRFTMETDGSTPADGFYFDNMSLTSYDPLFVGANEERQLKDWLLFPNPSTGHATIRTNFDQEESTEITLSDLSGKEVLKFSKNIPSGAHDLQLSLQDFPNGIYFLKWNSSSHKLFRKLIKM